MIAPERHDLTQQLSDVESAHHLWVSGERGAVSILFTPEVRAVIGHSVSEGPYVHRPAVEDEMPEGFHWVQEDCTYLPGRTWCWCTQVHIHLPARSELEATYDAGDIDTLYLYLELVYAGVAGAVIALCVSGSRKWHDADAVITRLCALECAGLAVVIEGGAPGADRIAGRWASRARKRGVGWVRFPAEWERLGKKAGPVRNAQMVTYLLQAAELGWEPMLLAFPLGASPGTRNMISQCKAAGVHGTVVKPATVRA